MNHYPIHILLILLSALLRPDFEVFGEEPGAQLPQDIIREKLKDLKPQTDANGSLVFKTDMGVARWDLGGHLRDLRYIHSGVWYVNSAFVWRLELPASTQESDAKLKGEINALWKKQSSFMPPDASTRGLNALNRACDFYLGISRAILEKKFEPNPNLSCGSGWYPGEVLSVWAEFSPRPGKLLVSIEYCWTDANHPLALANRERFVKEHPDQMRFGPEDSIIYEIALAKYKADLKAGKKAKEPDRPASWKDLSPGWDHQDQYMKLTLAWQRPLNLTGDTIEDSINQLKKDSNCTTLWDLGGTHLGPVRKEFDKMPVLQLYRQFTEAAGLDFEIRNDAIFIYEKGRYPRLSDESQNPALEKRVLELVNNPTDTTRATLKELGPGVFITLRAAYHSVAPEKREAVAKLYSSLIGNMWFCEEPALTKVLNGLAPGHMSVSYTLEGIHSLQERLQKVQKEDLKNEYTLEIDPKLASETRDFSLLPMSTGNLLRWMARVHGAKILLSDKTLKFVQYTPSPEDPNLGGFFDERPAKPIKPVDVEF